MRVRLTPVAVLSAAMAFGLVLALLMVSAAVNAPWLGLKLSSHPEYDLIWIDAIDPEGPARNIPRPGALISLTGANGESINLTPTDRLDEPDVFATYAEMGNFFARQGRIEAILSQNEVEIYVLGDNGAQSRTRVDLFRQRSISALPAAFWVQIAVGLAGFWIGAWVWSFRRSDWGTRFLALAGVSLLVSAFPAAVYSTRELAIDGTIFRFLSGVNHAGGLLFGVGMIGLFLSYPRQLVRSRYLALPALLFGAWLAVDQLQLVSGPPIGIHLGVVTAMVTILVLVFVQYRVTRGDPLARAALTWFGLSVAIGAGAFVLTIVVPNLIGSTPVLLQGYAFMFFLLIYVGIALGVVRYRLFELEDWAFRILFYVCGVLLLVTLDALLIFAVAVERIPAFGLSLLIVAFLYLPFRDAIGRLLIDRRAVSRKDLFRQVVDIALTPPGADQLARWRQLLQDVFNPLSMDTTDIRADAAAATPVDLTDEGVGLSLPSVGDLPGLRLDYADGGRRLFSPRDATLASELRAMLAHALESRQSYERGVAEERERIARDMHDNIGVQLLSALHSKEVGRKDSMIRETLSDLRDIVNNASRPGISMDETLADLRVEIAEHLATAGIGLDWKAVADEGRVGALAPQAAHALRSVIREATSNAIKHAGGSTMAITIRHHGDTMAVSIEDDGSGFDTSATTSGNGMANMRARMVGLRGSFEISGDGTGTRIEARFPLADGGALP
ncbi:sensor histidine kinase [Parasphingorhabdus sp.]|uniref:sensor histidine kinase n=1 Tax=Parasphingorhabdus sp. TaxID=2709688 RepID=UPI0035937D3D